MNVLEDSMEAICSYKCLPCAYVFHNAEFLLATYNNVAVNLALHWLDLSVIVQCLVLVVYVSQHCSCTAQFLYTVKTDFTCHAQYSNYIAATHNITHIKMLEFRISTSKSALECANLAEIFIEIWKLLLKSRNLA